MHSVLVVLVFLLAIIFSIFVSRLLPIKVPLPLLQILVGMALANVSGFQVDLDPKLFFLLFIPPLLFLDGWRIPKGAFFRDWQPILTLAIGLVLFTVVGIGFMISWLIPSMPLAVAFALAAILAPTDPVAVSAITANAPMPSRLMHMLEGESLLNDATGLVCFSFAVTAALTGAFSLPAATLSFLAVAGGGVLCGLVVTAAIAAVNRLLVRRTGEEPVSQVLVSLLIPFAAYLTAEHVHVSGILSAAVAGIAMHYMELAGRPLAITRMQRHVVWDTLQAVLNGGIFILLGEQLPRILRSLPDVAASMPGVESVWHMATYLIIITLVLGLLRFAWVWASMRVTIFRTVLLGEKREMPPMRLLLVMVAAGVRGAITLAGILTLPLLMPDGSIFPARDMAIFIATGVIVLSLVGTSIALPPLARGLPHELPSSASQDHEASARAAAAEAAIRAIQEASTEPAGDAEQEHVRAEAAAHLTDVYRRRLQYGDPSGEDLTSIRNLAEAERAMRLKALMAERDELYRLRRSHNIEDVLHQRLVREIDFMEASLVQPRPH